MPISQFPLFPLLPLSHLPPTPSPSPLLRDGSAFPVKSTKSVATPH